MSELSRYIDHTLLKPDANQESLKTLCQEAVSYGFFSVCVNSANVEFCKKTINDLYVGDDAEHDASQVTLPRIASTIGFPLGAMSTLAKCKELEHAKQDGADEFDFVINIGRVKSGDYDYVKKEIALLKKTAGISVIKAIFETCLLSPQEIKTLCKLCVEVGADFVKTSTGFSTGGASPEAVAIMLEEVRGSTTKVKASGGIRSRSVADRYIAMGVMRLGTSSGILLVNAETQDASTDY